MRALVVARQKMPPPAEMMPGLAQGFAAWREQYRDKWESFFFFATVTGGCGIANVANETELFQMILEWPLTPFSDIEVHPVVDGDEALGRWVEQIQALAAQSG
jgi:hypothetical protein